MFFFLVHCIDSQSRNGKTGVSFLFFFLCFFLFSFARDGRNSFLTAFLVFTADVLDQVASVHCICSCLSKGSGQEVMVSLPLTVISLSLGSRSRYTCSVLVAYFMKYFLLFFFLCQWLSLLFSPRPGLDLDLSALVLDLLFSWSCRTLVLVVSLVSLEAFWTTPLRQVEPN